MNNYDVIVVGTGPAGIFAALELSKKNLKVLLLDKGASLEKRQKLKELNTGWGGAGAFSDGKLNLSLDVGGSLTKFFKKRDLLHLVDYTDNIYQKFGAPEKLYKSNNKQQEKLSALAKKSNLQLITSKIRHLGTDNCLLVLKKMEKYLNKYIDIKMECAIQEIITKKNEVKAVVDHKNNIYYTKYLILAPGREGAGWLTQEAKKLKIKLLNNPVDLGVRVEVKKEVLAFFTKSIFELKLVYYSSTFNDRVRTFCMCPEGEVVKEKYNGIISVNGHSYAHKKTNNTNFAILVSTNFTEPFKEPIAYGEYLTKLANLISQGVILQKLGDLTSGRRSTWERIKQGKTIPTLKDVTPGDLSFVLPYRHLKNILEMLQALNKLAPGIYSPDTLFYGIEVKFYSSCLELTTNLETRIKNLFACGDGAGITRGLMQASMSGIIAAKEILKREQKN